MLDTVLAPQLSLKPVEGREDDTRQFGVLSKEEAGDRHQFATGSGAHTSNHQGNTEKGSRCELTFAMAKERDDGPKARAKGNDASRYKNMD